MGTRIFVGNLPFSATEDQLRELFSQHGEVASAEIVKDKFTDRSRGFAYVEMATGDPAAAALAALERYASERAIKAEHADEAAKPNKPPLTVNIARSRNKGEPSPQLPWQSDVCVTATSSVLATFADGTKWLVVSDTLRSSPLPSDEIKELAQQARQAGAEPVVARPSAAGVEYRSAITGRVLSAPRIT